MPFYFTAFHPKKLLLLEKIESHFMIYFLIKYSQNGPLRKFNLDFNFRHLTLALFICSYQVHNVLLLPRFQVDLVNIGGADIVDGNHKLILGLIWSIILHWQVRELVQTLSDGPTRAIPAEGLFYDLILWSLKDTICRTFGLSHAYLQRLVSSCVHHLIRCPTVVYVQSYRCHLS